MKHIYSMMNDNKLNKEIIGDDYPTYEQYVNEYHANKNMSTTAFALVGSTENILTIANKLRKGDQVTITSESYQVHISGMGTSNFPTTKG